MFQNSVPQIRANEESLIHHDAFKIAVASAIVVLVTAVALTLIMTLANPTTSPEVFASIGGYPFLWTVCTVKGVSLLVFVTSTAYLVCLGWRTSADTNNARKRPGESPPGGERPPQMSYEEQSPNLQYSGNGSQPQPTVSFQPYGCKPSTQSKPSIIDQQPYPSQGYAYGSQLPMQVSLPQSPPPRATLPPPSFLDQKESSARNIPPVTQQQGGTGTVKGKAEDTLNNKPPNGTDEEGSLTLKKRFRKVETPTPKPKPAPTDSRPKNLFAEIAPFLPGAIKFDREQHFTSEPTASTSPATNPLNTLTTTNTQPPPKPHTSTSASHTPRDTAGLKKFIAENVSGIPLAGTISFGKGLIDPPLSKHTSTNPSSTPTTTSTTQMPALAATPDPTPNSAPASFTPLPSANNLPPKLPAVPPREKNNAKEGGAEYLEESFFAFEEDEEEFIVIQPQPHEGKPSSPTLTSSLSLLDEALPDLPASFTLTPQGRPPQLKQEPTPISPPSKPVDQEPITPTPPRHRGHGRSHSGSHPSSTKENVAQQPAPFEEADSKQRSGLSKAHGQTIAPLPPLKVKPAPTNAPLPSNLQSEAGPPSSVPAPPPVEITDQTSPQPLSPRHLAPIQMERLREARARFSQPAVPPQASATPLATDVDAPQPVPAIKPIKKGDEGLSTKRKKSEKEKEKEAPAPISSEKPAQSRSLNSSKLIPTLQSHVFPPILSELEAFMIGVNATHCQANGKPVDPQNVQKIKEAMKAVGELLNSVLGNPRTQVLELLYHYGRGKTKTSIALRRLVAAFNSGDPQKYEEEKKKYDAVARGHSLEFPQKLAGQKFDNGQILDGFVDDLIGRFCSTNEQVDALGQQILNYIFNNVKVDPAKRKKVLAELSKLRNKEKETLRELEKTPGIKDPKKRKEAESKAREKIASHIEEFVKFVFDTALKSNPEGTARLDAWHQDMLHCLVQGETVIKLQSLFRMIAHNLRIMHLMFDKEAKEPKTFPVLDCTFLASESSDFIKPEGPQTELLQLQCEINYALKQEKKPKEPIALVIVTKANEHLFTKITETCKAAHPRQVEIPPAFQKRVDSLKMKHSSTIIDIIALPISLNDHLFKQIKGGENSWGGWGAKKILSAASSLGVQGTLLEYVKPLLRNHIVESLPKLEKEDMDNFDTVFNSLFDALISPVIDGAFTPKPPFSVQFQQVIENEGLKLASKLEDFSARLSTHDGLTADNIIEIQGIWQDALKGGTQAFARTGGTTSSFEAGLLRELNHQLETTHPPRQQKRTDYPVEYTPSSGRAITRKFNFNKEELNKLTSFFEGARYPSKTHWDGDHEGAFRVFEYLSGTLLEKKFEHSPPHLLFSTLQAATHFGVQRLQLLMQKHLLHHMMQGWRLEMPPAELNRSGWTYLAKCQAELELPAHYSERLPALLERHALPPRVETPDFAVSYHGETYLFAYAKADLASVSDHFARLALSPVPTVELKGNLPKETVRALQYLCGALDEGTITKLSNNDLLDLHYAAFSFAIPRLQYVTEQVLVDRMINGQLKPTFQASKLKLKGLHCLLQCQEEINLRQMLTEGASASKEDKEKEK